MNLATTVERLVADLHSGPFHNRPEEFALYRPFVGRTMLEFGCKINKPHTYKAYFESAGFEHVSIDLNGLHGSLVKDLRKPLNLGTFDMVSNIGTSEHVDVQEPVWRNLVEACAVGSVLVSTTPKPGDWTWHGWHHPQREFYVALAELNGFTVERLYETGVEPRRMWFARLVRHTVTDFVMPTEHMHFNPEAIR